MGRSGMGAGPIPPAPGRGRANRPQAESSDPGEPAGGPTSGSRAAGPPDAAAVCLALRVLREVVGDLAPGDDPHRVVVLPADSILPVLGAAIRLLEDPPGRGR